MKKPENLSEQSEVDLRGELLKASRQIILEMVEKSQSIDQSTEYGHIFAIRLFTLEKIHENLGQLLFLDTFITENKAKFAVGLAIAELFQKDPDLASEDDIAQFDDVQKIAFEWKERIMEVLNT